MFIDIHTHRSDAEVRTVGVHPFEADKCTEESLLQLEMLASDSSVFGIGEIGLDYRPEYRSSAARQREVFAAQVQIANRVAKPIVVHQVRAMDDTLRILYKAKVPVIIHGFSGSEQSAARFLSRGYYLSFGHIMLNNIRLQEVIRSTPMDRIFLETDDRQDCTIEQIYGKVAQVRGITIDDLVKQIEQNYRDVRLAAENGAIIR